MKSYELLYIITSDITLQESENEKKKIEEFIKNKGGEIIKHTPLETQILAYPIKKKTSGHIGILQFQINPLLIEEINKWLLNNKNILRHTLIKKSIKIQEEKIAPLEKETLSETKTPSAKSKVKEKIELKDIEEKLEEILNE